jgi:sigma-B regulation protein RsbU (phosphoserine phosphatase)
MNPVPQKSKNDSYLGLINDINRQISSSSDVIDVLGFILDALREIIPYESGAVFLVNPKTQGLKYAMHRGSSGPERTQFPTDIVRLAEREPAGYHLETSSASSTSSARLTVPIINGRGTVGTFQFAGTPGIFAGTILELLTVVASQAAIFVDKAVLSKELREKRRIEEELRIAREVQLSLLPAEAPKIDALDLHGINIPSYKIGGDYFDFIPIVDGHLGIAVADVAGKGVPASLIMASFRAVLRAEIRNNYAIRTILAKVNRVLKETLRDDQFVSAFYGVLDLARRRFTYSNAGHHPAIVFRADGKRRYLKSGGLVLGIFDGVGYNEQFIDLVPGDLLLLYTDGLVEAENPSGEMYGRGRLERFVAANADMNAHALCDAIYADMSRFTRAPRPADDTTIVIAKILG